MRSLTELYALYTDRRAEHSADGSAMVDLALIYDGGLVTRIAEIDAVAESSVPNIVAQGIDAYARFTASVQPDVDTPALRPNIAASRKKASDRAKAIQGWWQHSLMTALDYQRFRYYYGYGFMPVRLCSDPRNVGVPVWEALNPMGVLPGPRQVAYSPEVPDCFTTARRSARWVKQTYGVQFGRDVRDDTMLEVVRYSDAEQDTVFCVGAASPDMPSYPSGRADGFGGGTYGGYWSERGTHIERLGTTSGNDGAWLVMLSSTPNYAGVCLVSCPGVISLSKVSGFVNGILGKHKLHARLMGLTVEGIARGILPNEWIELDPSQNGQGVIREADGLRGVRGVIEGGRLNVPQINPGYQTMPLLDRLEAYSRSEAGVISEFGGESGNNIRTRARGDAVAGNVVDPRVREAHEIAQIAREHEVRLGVAIAKGYGGSRPQSFYVNWHRATEQMTYDATDLFETDESVIRYPLAGADLQQLIIAAAQSIGTGMMATATARRLNPLVEDADQEAIDIRVEAAEQVLTANLQTIIEQSPEDAAYAIREIRKGTFLEDVLDGVQKRVQERQATAGPPGAPDGMAAPGTPEAQPGLGAPGVADQPTPVIDQAPQSARNLAQLLMTTRRPAMTTPAERAG